MIGNLIVFFFCPSSGTVPEDEVESNKLKANEEIVAQLVSMGFNHLHCEKAAIYTSNAGIEEAMNWLLAHMDDAGTLRRFFKIDFPLMGSNYELTYVCFS